MNAEPEAAVAIVRALAPEESILLIRRAERHNDPWSGHWSFPGGRRDRGDPDLLHTALRELDEECGIRLERQSLETALAPTIAGRAAGPYLTVAPFVFPVPEPMPTVLDPREAVEALWVPVRMLQDPARHWLQSVPGMPAGHQFPAMDLKGVPLWGFTYRLLTEWLASR
jgi:8-oxo-dGTP pyrophosphatase MutT (NUDIX family)